MKKLVFLLLLFVLYGCSNNKIEVLNPPQNLRFEVSSNTLRWDSVPDALSYVLSVDGQTIDLNQTSYVINLPSGRYEVKVRAVYETGQSRYTVPIMIDIIKNETLNYQVSNDLTFDLVPGATHYQLKVYNALNDVILDEAITSPFNLDDFMGNLRFELFAYYQTSVISSEIFFINFQGLTYTKDTLDLNISLLESVSEFYMNDNLISSEYYNQSDLELILSTSFLDQKTDDTYVMKFVGSFTTYRFLTITSYERPIIVSNSQATYNGSDLIFIFDLKGGSFEGLASTPVITLTDYSFDEQTLVISKDFIENILSNEPTRQRIIFSYVISNGPYTVIGYLTVNLNN